MSKIVKKITAKTVGATKIGQSFNILGRVTRARVGNTTLGEFFFLEGAFEAINNQTGEIYNSSTAILPAVAATLVANALQFAQEAEKNSTIEFALKIAKEAADNAMGQAWTVEPLIEPLKESDPLAALRLRLPAPKPAKQVTAENTVAHIGDKAKAKK